MLHLTNLYQFFFNISSCWLSLEGGLLYAFVGPAAAVVLVNISDIFNSRKQMNSQNKEKQMRSLFLFTSTVLYTFVTYFTKFSSFYIFNMCAVLFVKQGSVLFFLYEIKIYKKYQNTQDTSMTYFLHYEIMFIPKTLITKTNILTLITFSPYLSECLSSVRCPPKLLDLKFHNLLSSWE